MATIRHHTRIARKPDEVWAQVSDPVALKSWFPGLTDATVKGNVRTISMGDLQIDEEIVTNDADLRRFQYRISGGPVQPEYHLGTVDVLDDADGSLVVYSTDVQPDELKDLFDGTISGAVQGLKSALES